MELHDSAMYAPKRRFAREEDWMAQSAALERLLAHYPGDLMRDGLFLSRAALEAESANGHV